jgi:hypothetical protein
LPRLNLAQRDGSWGEGGHWSVRGRRVVLSPLDRVVGGSRDDWGDNDVPVTSSGGASWDTELAGSSGAKSGGGGTVIVRDSVHAALACVGTGHVLTVDVHVHGSGSVGDVNNNVWVVVAAGNGELVLVCETVLVDLVEPGNTAEGSWSHELSAQVVGHVQRGRALDGQPPGAVGSPDALWNVPLALSARARGG